MSGCPWSPVPPIPTVICPRTLGSSSSSWKMKIPRHKQEIVSPAFHSETLASSFCRRWVLSPAVSHPEKPSTLSALAAWNVHTSSRHLPQALAAKVVLQTLYLSLSFKLPKYCMLSGFTLWAIWEKTCKCWLVTPHSPSWHSVHV